MKATPKSLILKGIGLISCILPVTIATLGYFPVWKSRGAGELVSGFTVFLLIICVYPLIKAIKRLLRSPSVFTVWLLLFITFMLIDSIAHEMTVISFVGMISNLIGSVFFKLARKED